MINNLPTQGNFNNLAKDCLLQSMNNLFEISKEYELLKEDIYEDLNEVDLWKYHIGDLRTCLVLIYQALELYLKGEICNESPYLLLDTPKQDWPTNLESKDKDFNEMFTISGDQLIRIFNAICLNVTKRSEINKLFNDIRKKRNVITHSTPTLEITPQYLIEASITCFTLFEGNDQWWLQTKKQLEDHPLFGYGDFDYAVASLSFRLSFFKAKVGLKFLNKNSDLDLSARKYYCPSCSHNLGDLGHDNLEVAKWAILIPNSPDGTSVLCYNCQNKFDVLREKCTNKNRKGNVISYDDICLTCLEEIEEIDEDEE